MIRSYVFLRLYYDWGSFDYQIVKFGNIGISHANAAVAGGLSNLVLMVGAVDINITVQGVRIVGVEAVKPKDAGLNEVIGH